MIVNDFENKKTLDTQTGVYLTRSGGHIRDAIWLFDVIDGETKVSISTVRDYPRLPDGTLDITYNISDPPHFKGGPQRKGYINLISDLMAAFCDLYGDWNGTRGKMVARAKIGDTVKQAIEAWENGHE
jgi:hypothetical protein